MRGGGDKKRCLKEGDHLGWGLPSPLVGPVCQAVTGHPGKEQEFEQNKEKSTDNSRHSSFSQIPSNETD